MKKLNPEKQILEDAKMVLSKQKIIKDVWGELYEKYKDRISLIDGYIHHRSNKVYDECKSLFEISFHPHYVSIFRPESLKGIEDNNGWIKIENEEDLPKDSAYYWIITNSNNIHLTEYEVDFKQFFTKDYAYNDYEITHYQPIEKPKPPIY